MDILDQYNKEKPAVLPVPSERAATPNESEMHLDEHTYRSRAILGELRAPKMVSWVFRHSGGALKNERQAAYALLGLACIIGGTAILLFVRGIRGPYVKNGGPGLSSQELEQYRKIQPF